MRPVAPRARYAAAATEDGPSYSPALATGRPVSSEIDGLELEHRLQRALRDLGLVGRIWSEELRALRDRVDDRRHVVVVHARAEEGDLVLRAGVARGELGQPLVDRLLGHAVRQLQRTVEPHAGGQVGEQLVDRADADLGEHLLAVGVGRGGVARHRGRLSRRRRAAPGRPRRTAARRPPRGRSA